MSRAPKLMVRIMLLGAAVVALLIVSAPASSSGSPYLSALSDLAATPALAAKTSCRGMCEFASPGYVCTEGFHTKCTHPSTGGCVTVSC